MSHKQETKHGRQSLLLQPIKSSEQKRQQGQKRKQKRKTKAETKSETKTEDKQKMKHLYQTSDHMAAGENSLFTEMIFF